MIPEYPWLELVGVRVPNNGEWVIHPEDEVIEASELGYVYPIVKPNNAYNVYHLEDLKIPGGYEADGETLKDAFCHMNANDLWLGVDGTIFSGHVSPTATTIDGRYYRLRLRKIAPKTKRVLVTIEEIVPDVDRGFGFIAEQTVQGLVKQFPHMYRIEERPL